MLNRTKKTQKWLIQKWFHSLMKEDGLYQNHMWNLDMMMLNGWFLLHFQKRLNWCGLDGMPRKRYVQKTQQIFYLPQINQSPTLAVVVAEYLKRALKFADHFKKKMLQLWMILLLQRLLCRYKLSLCFTGSLSYWAVFLQWFRKAYCWIKWSLYSQWG